MMKESKPYTSNWKEYWPLISSIFTFWLGLVIVDDIGTKNAVETQKLAHYQKVQYIYPHFKNYTENTSMVVEDFSEAYYMNTQQKNTVDTSTIILVGKKFFDGGDYALDARLVEMQNVCNIANSDRYWFSMSSQQSISLNCMMIQLGLNFFSPQLQDRLYYSCKSREAIQKIVQDETNNSIYISYFFPSKQQVLDSVDTYINEFCAMLDQQPVSVSQMSVWLKYCIVYQFFYRPYSENERIYTQELLPEEKVSNHLWIHLLYLFIAVVLTIILCSSRVWGYLKKLSLWDKIKKRFTSKKAHCE